MPGTTDAQLPGFDFEALPRETAEVATPARMLSEDEAYAIVADRVERETANLQQQVESLTAETANLRTQLENAEAQVLTERAAREQAEQTIADAAAAAQREAEIAARIEARREAAREALPGMADAFFTEERVREWAEMTDEAFQARCAELRTIIEALTPTPAAPAEQARESAMQGQEPQSGNKGTSSTTFVNILRGV